MPERDGDVAVGIDDIGVIIIILYAGLVFSAGRNYQSFAGKNR